MAIFYEIRYGRKAMMYTLWRVSMPTEKSKRYFEHYVQNLSTDYNIAIEKAQERAKLNGYTVNIDAPENLKEIVRGEDVIRWGKYRDTKVSNIADDKYLVWLFKGGFYKNENGEWVRKLQNDDTIRLEAERILLEKGLIVEYNDRLVTIEKAEELRKLEELNNGSNFIGEVGNKIKLEVNIEKITYFEGAYGLVWLFIMRTSDGDVVVYKGKCLEHPVLYRDLITDNVYNEQDKKFWKNLCKVGVSKGQYHTFYGNCKVEQKEADKIKDVDFKEFDANYINLKTLEFYNMCYESKGSIKVGDKVTIEGFIKEHSEYNGTKQTILSRVKTI